MQTICLRRFNQKRYMPLTLTSARAKPLSLIEIDFQFDQLCTIIKILMLTSDVFDESESSVSMGSQPMLMDGSNSLDTYDQSIALIKNLTNTPKDSSIFFTTHRNCSGTLTNPLFDTRLTLKDVARINDIYNKVHYLSLNIKNITKEKL